MNSNIDILIIGGGAAGLMAAVAAGKFALEKKININIILAEKNERTGKKLSTTGNGRCNLSNANIDKKYFHSQNMDLVETALSLYTFDDVINFFQKLGLETIQEEGRIYPYSQRAFSVLDILRLNAEKTSVNILTGCTVKSVKKDLSLNLFKVLTGEGECICPAQVIIATGGKAAPSTGSNGDGLRFLFELNHMLTPTYPVLTQLIIKNTFIKSLKGIRIKPCRLSLYENDKIIASSDGELQFTEYGLSGIPAMQVSGAMGPGIKKIKACINLLPEIPDILSYLKKRKRNLSLFNAENLFTGLFHSRIGEVLLKISDINPAKCIKDLNDNELSELSFLVENWYMDITGVRGYAHAQAMGGGASLEEFDIKDMQSLLVPGLFAAGEVLDVFGDCGGYNLHWAWVSGYLAGRGAAEACLKKDLY